jgi:glucose/mannose-6-phosphate isomerase
MDDMKKLVEEFPGQLREAVEIARKATLKAPQEIRHVLITGLGGSGIGGTIISELMTAECPVPIVVNKDYFIPAWVNNYTLVIACSYSGNTEETIQALEGAMKRNCRIVCITSGGRIAEMARSNGYDCIIIPGGHPPRACLGYSLIQLFAVLKHFNLAKSDFLAQCIQSADLLVQDKAEMMNEARRIAGVLFNRIPIIYAVDGFGGVATRFRQQINENSKMLCWHHVIPEMNHNELVGWTTKNDQLAVVLLRNETDYSRSQARLEISKEVFSKYTTHVAELWSKGNTALERSLYLIHVTDLVSVLLADMKQIDATEVNIINRLKGELAKI